MLLDVRHRMTLAGQISFVYCFRLGACRRGYRRTLRVVALLMEIWILKKIAMWQLTRQVVKVEMSDRAMHARASPTAQNRHGDSVLPQYHRARFLTNHCPSSSSFRSWQTLHQLLSMAMRFVPRNFRRKLVVSKSWSSGEQTRARRPFFRRSARPMRSLKCSTARGRRCVADLRTVYSISWYFRLDQPWHYWTI